MDGVGFEVGVGLPVADDFVDVDVDWFDSGWAVAGGGVLVAVVAVDFAVGVCGDFAVFAVGVFVDFVVDFYAVVGGVFAGDGLNVIGRFVGGEAGDVVWFVGDADVGAVAFACFGDAVGGVEEVGGGVAFVVADVEVGDGDVVLAVGVYAFGVGTCVDEVGAGLGSDVSVSIGGFVVSGCVSGALFGFAGACFSAGVVSAGIVGFVFGEVGGASDVAFG